jgi:hypothetical protein
VDSLRYGHTSNFTGTSRDRRNMKRTKVGDEDRGLSK